MAEVEIAEQLPVGVLSWPIHKPPREEESGNDAVKRFCGMFAVPNDVVIGVRASLGVVNEDVGSAVWIWDIACCPAGHERVEVVRAATPAACFRQHLWKKT